MDSELVWAHPRGQGGTVERGECHGHQGMLAESPGNWLSGATVRFRGIQDASCAFELDLREFSEEGGVGDRGEIKRKGTSPPGAPGWGEGAILPGPAASPLSDPLRAGTGGDYLFDMRTGAWRWL